MSAKGNYTVVRKLQIYCILAITLWTMGPIANATAGKWGFPFCAGERLVFNVKWGLIPAGEATLEIRNGQKGGIPVFHFVMKARTYSYVDLFYKVRDRIDAYTDTHLTHSLLYVKKNRGRKKRDITVQFDWKQKKAHYIKNGRKRKTISVPSGAFDPLSMFYAFRSKELKVGKTIELPVCDGKKCIQANALVAKREKITIGDKEYETFLVIPRMRGIGGVFEKSKDARLRIWVTADSARLPVRIKSKVIVGSFVAELKHAHVPGYCLTNVRME